MNEIVCSLDIEAHGDDPLKHNLRSFGIVAMTLEKEMLASITFNCADVPGLENDPKLTAWWEQHPAAYAAALADQVPAQHAFRQYRAWWNRLHKYGYAYLSAAPVGYDIVWFNVSCFRHLGRLPHQRMVNDLRSLTSGALGKPFTQCGKSEIPPEFFDLVPHTHVAEDDALEQACLTVNLIRHSRGLPVIHGYVDKRKPGDIWNATTKPVN